VADEPRDAGTALVPLREQTVDFYGDVLPAGQLADGTILVPVRPICTALGLNWPAQSRRLLRDPVLARARGVAIMATPTGPQEQVCLPLKVLPGWLFGLKATRVRAELRAKIERYQAECYEVLWNAFKGEIVPPAPPPSDLSPAAQALALAEAVASLARQQLELEGRYSVMAEWMRPFIGATRAQQRQTATTLAAHDERLTALELQLSAGATISEAQAAEISLTVRTLGQRLVATGAQEGYHLVYSELYRRYGIASYKMLPAARYEAVLAWLRAWYTQVDAAGAGA
jgi:hypothetical protein